MALNSTRELIVTDIVDTLTNVTSIAEVKRRRMADIDELKAIPTTQLPYISVTGGLPEPIQKKSGRKPGGIETVVSTLAVEILCYNLAYDNPDVALSDLLDDIWAALYADQTRGGIALSTDVIPQVEPAYINPYILFRVVCNVVYVHDITHI